MARDWRDLFIVDGAPPAEAESGPATQERRRGMFRRLRENLRKTRQALTSEIQATLFEPRWSASSSARRPTAGSPAGRR